jgi:hypothetical protein
MKTFSKLNLGLLALLVAVGISAQAQQPVSGGTEPTKREQVAGPRESVGGQGEGEQQKSKNKIVKNKELKGKKHKSKKKKS